MDQTRESIDFYAPFITLCFWNIRRTSRICVHLICGKTTAVVRGSLATNPILVYSVSAPAPRFFPYKDLRLSIVPNLSSVLTAMSLESHIKLSVAFIVDINFDRSERIYVHRTRCTGRVRDLFDCYNDCRRIAPWIWAKSFQQNKNTFYTNKQSIFEQGPSFKITKRIVRLFWIVVMSSEERA